MAQIGRRQARRTRGKALWGERGLGTPHLPALLLPGALPSSPSSCKDSTGLR